MLNKNFQGWLNRNDKKNTIDNFLKSLENLDNAKLVKIDTQDSEDGHIHLYNEFSHEIKSYKNLLYFRLFDLGSSLLPIIEKKNYSTAILICRSIFETILIFMFRMIRVSDRIENKNWKSLYIEILNFKFVPSWKEDGDIDWNKVFPHIKKFHINDAIRAFSKNMDTDKGKRVEDLLFKDYALMSDIAHPNQANRSLYLSTRDNLNEETGINKRRRHNFSVNHADNIVFPLIVKIIEMFLILDKQVSDVVNESLTKLERFRMDLEIYQKNNFIDDLNEIQPFLMDEMNELKKQDMRPKELVDQLVKASFKKNE